MQEVAQNGGNTVRIMGTCYNAALRWTVGADCQGDVYSGFDGLNNINQKSAAKIDDMFNVAKDNNININYVLLNTSIINQIITDPKEWAAVPITAPTAARPAAR